MQDVQFRSAAECRSETACNLEDVVGRRSAIDRYEIYGRVGRCGGRLRDHASPPIGLTEQVTRHVGLALARRLEREPTARFDARPDTPSLVFIRR